MRSRLPIATEGRDRLLSPHKGLILDRYLADSPQDVGHAPALRALTGYTSAHQPYKLAFERWKAVSESWPSKVLLLGTLRSRLALGLGIESVLEIGCRLHATYGVPVIPASSIKGALRSHLESQSRFNTAAAFLFGSSEDAGFARVHDAWWVPDGEKSGLALDVITVHHQSYYSGTSAPAGTESPIPVSFLTVTGKFYFTVQVPNPSWASFVSEALKDLLTNKGIGAKRSAGYGRFRF